MIASKCQIDWRPGAYDQNHAAELRKAVVAWFGDLLNDNDAVRLEPEETVPCMDRRPLICIMYHMYHVSKYYFDAIRSQQPISSSAQFLQLFPVKISLTYWFYWIELQKLYENAELILLLFQSVKVSPGIAAVFTTCLPSHRYSSSTIQPLPPPGRPGAKAKIGWNLCQTPLLRARLYTMTIINQPSDKN